MSSKFVINGATVNSIETRQSQNGFPYSIVNITMNVPAKGGLLPQQTSIIVGKQELSSQLFNGAVVDFTGFINVNKKGYTSLSVSQVDVKQQQQQYQQPAGAPPQQYQQQTPPPAQQYQQQQAPAQQHQNPAPQQQQIPATAPPPQQQAAAPVPSNNFDDDIPF